MRKSWLRLYLPFIGLVAAQALLVSVAPSIGNRGGSQLAAGAGARSNNGSGGAFDDAAGADGGLLDGGVAGTGDGGANGEGGPGGTGGVGGNGPGGGPGGAASSAGSKYATGALGNDIAHCSKAGSKAGPDRNFDLYYYAPPCQPKWPAGADNGGATYRGVTPTKITVVRYNPRPNPAVDGILKGARLYTEPAEGEDYQENVMEPFMNKRYEFWGRKVDFRTFTGNCEYSPPDIPCLVKEAQEIVDKFQPFAVIAITGLPSATYDVFARNKVISFGGWHYAEEFFTKRAPYRYDILMDGSRAVRNLADYYCKKLVGRPADHAGPVIHPTIGSRDNAIRRIGIAVPEDPATAPNGDLLKSLLEGGRCGKKGDVPVLFKYASDISKATTQTQTIMQQLINNKVTTLICVCDPVAPRFVTTIATQQNYYPEHLIEGISLIDYDLVARQLYAPEQWQHAFGVSHLFANAPLSESYEQTEWRAEGKQGTVYANMGLIGGYERVFGWFLQQAGPRLTPDTVKNAMLDREFTRGGWEETGHNPVSFRCRYGPGDWTAWDDAREVYYSATERSALDGQPGAYVNVNGGRRYNVEEWSATNGVPYIPRASS